jgi:hypothetical protein
MERPGGERVSIIDGISNMPWIPKLHPHRRFRVRLSLARERIEVRVAQNERTI